MGNKMKEWFEANQEIYAEFKSKIHSTLDILSQDGTNVAECDETYSLQNMLLEAMAASMLVFLANVLMFLAYDLSICLATLGLRCLPSTADMSFSQTLLT